MGRRASRSSLLIVTFACAALGACSSDAAVNDGATLTIKGSASAPPSVTVVAGNRLASASAADYATGDPSSLTVGMYALYISQNADCSAPILVEDHGTTVQPKDFVGNPVLFSGSPANGSYKCLMIRMSDVLHFTPATTFGSCTAGQTYFGDIYRDGENDWKDKDGATIVGHGTDESPVDDHVTIFITRDPSAVMARGVSEHQIIPLDGDLVVPGHTTFYWNGQGSVIDYGSCGINPGRPAFR